jgi:zinc transport system substrate-binding protein
MVNLSDGLDLIAGEVMQHGDHVHLEGVDPHIWMSPALVKQASEKIAAKLGEINPEKRELYQTNYKRFAEETDALDQEIRAALAPYRGRSVVTFHPSISYFARDYGLNLLSLEADGKEPAPQHMAGVIAQARKEQIKAIYIQSEFDQENARVFAEEIKGKVVEIKPLSENWAENLTTMTQLFIENF